MKLLPLPLPAVLAALPFALSVATAAENLQHQNSYRQVYGETKATVSVDPRKELPRYPAVEPKDAIATWQVKPGFKLELAAHEPQVRDPIAITFDENGRMFVCEMIDYSEERDRTPHLGRISMLEDRDGDGHYETSTVFADNLPWPTGLIWANGGLFVGATPDIWRFEDRDGDGHAEVREKVFTGFGTGLAKLNVQALINSFSWGQDNRVHVQAAPGNRGKIKSLKRPELGEVEIAARDFWFDPRSYDFGFEAGGAQFGMSFDDYGRRFACSNSDHLQFFVFDDRYAGRNPFFDLPTPRQSIATDGGAAEVFRISPDEPWRIIRTRWRIAGVVKGAVEGGGRVSGYFTGASGTTVFRGDAYGADFVGNTFTGDAGGQLIHRKTIEPKGASLVGRRPDDEQKFEFAASRDTWVRVVNFANAPDGTLHVCDMYREVIEHPWSLPEEIKRHLDLNSGNTRGRIYRIVPSDAGWKPRRSVALGRASISELVTTLEHPNGWHRDTASRLLYERQDKSAVPPLRGLLRASSSPRAKHHALGVLEGLGALDDESVATALMDPEPRVRERAIVSAEGLARSGALSPSVMEKLAALAADPDARVRLQLAFTLGSVLADLSRADAVVAPRLQALAAEAYGRLATRDFADNWISAALLSGPPAVVNATLFPALTRDPQLARQAASFAAKLIEIYAASKPADGNASLIAFVAQPGTSAAWLRAFGDGLRRAGTTIEKVDTGRKLAAVFSQAAALATDANAAPAARLDAIQVLGVAPFTQAREPLIACLGPGHAEDVQAAAITVLARRASEEVTQALVRGWPHYHPAARTSALAALVAREDRIMPLLQAVGEGTVKPTDFSAAQVQSLTHHKNARIAALAKTTLASVIPPSREEVTAQFQPALALRGDATRGRTHYLGRCMVCHRAEGQGLEVGPELESVKSKGREALLVAILDPHKEVAPQFIAYEVNTRDGNAYTGIITRDDATSLSLKIMGGAEVAVPRANVKGSKSSGKSLMPEGLETGMSVQDMADLLTFIEELK